jgi:hypothetical protein
MRMDVLLHDRCMRAWQLGAVGTLPSHRGRGLQRQLLPRLLEHTPAQELVFLFANHSVIDFYPRFGFQRVRQKLFRADCSVAPQGAALRTLELANADDRTLVLRIAAAAEPVTTLFGARGYGGTILWYWANLHRRALRHAPDHDAVLIVEQDGELLRVYDVLCAAQIDLAAYLPRLITRPFKQLEFGFTPTRYWSSAVAGADHTDSPLFVRGPHRLPEQPFKFPMLAQT